MKLHDLRPAEGAHKKKKRVARGTSGRGGKTAGRGTKGQNSRSGGGVRPYFEGGQLPLVRRLPHLRGFTNLFRVRYSVVNVERLGVFQVDSEVDPGALAAAGMIKSAGEPIKILGMGDLDHALTVSAHKFSASARKKIEKAGGKVIELELE
jgi:large subunit ribosomal protein L15